jgi:hypothetical protein
MKPGRVKGEEGRENADLILPLSAAGAIPSPFTLLTSKGESSWQ